MRSLDARVHIYKTAILLKGHLYKCHSLPLIGIFATVKFRVEFESGNIYHSDSQQVWNVAIHELILVCGVCLGVSINNTKTHTLGF